MKKYIKSLFVIIVLIFITYINAQGQNIDDILKECQEKRELDRKVLDNYRQKRKYTRQEEIYCGDQFFTFKYLEDSLYQKLQGKGIMPDSAMQVRILQLLNNEFYKGELEMLINDELKSDKYVGLPDSILKIRIIELKERFSSKLPHYKIYMLIRACELLNNKQILKRIEDLYNDPEYIDLKKELLNCLLLGHVEPYTSECLIHSKYDPSLSGSEQLYNIKHLEYIYTQESFREIAEYLFSKAYWEDHIMDDIGIIDSIDKIQESDSMIVEDFELILEDDLIPIHHEEIRYNYYYAYAFDIIKAVILNDDFYAMLTKLGMDNNKNIKKDFLTLERRCEIYKWMKKNYGKYIFRKRWK